MKTKILITIMLVFCIISSLALTSFALEEGETGTGTGFIPSVSKIDYGGAPTQYELFRSLGELTPDYNDFVIYPYNGNYYALRFSKIKTHSNKRLFVSINDLTESDGFTYAKGKWSNHFHTNSFYTDIGFRYYDVSGKDGDNPIIFLPVSMKEMFLNRSLTTDGGVIYQATTKFNLSDLRSGDFFDVLKQITFLLPIIAVSIVGFLAFRKVWSFLKGEVREA